MGAGRAQAGREHKPAKQSGVDLTEHSSSLTHAWLAAGLTSAPQPSVAFGASLVRSQCGRQAMPAAAAPAPAAAAAGKGVPACRPSVWGIAC